MSPALRLHLDSPLINPVHEHEIVPQRVVVCGTLAAKSVVCERCRNANPLLVSLTERPSSL